MWEGGDGRIGEWNFPLGAVGSRAWGDNRKKVHSAQRREGPKCKARLMGLMMLPVIPL